MHAPTVRHHLSLTCLLAVVMLAYYLYATRNPALPLRPYVSPEVHADLTTAI
jgi:hypothetical protein